MMTTEALAAAQASGVIPGPQNDDLVKYWTQKATRETDGQLARDLVVQSNSKIRHAIVRELMWRLRDDWSVAERPWLNDAEWICWWEN